MLYIIDEMNKPLPKEITPFAVVGGDHHIHAWKHPDPETRIRSSMDVLARGAADARRLDVPLIVNGDLTHDKNNLNPAVTSELMSFFQQEKSIGTKIILNVGNHERTEKYHDLHTLKCFEPVVDLVASSPRLIRLAHKKWHDQKERAINVMLVPFYYNHKQAMTDIDLFKLFDRVPTGESLVFVGHYPVDGAEVNGIKPHFGIKYEDFRPQQFEALLFNDIHKSQPISEKAYHLGCTHQNNFGEEGYSYGWWVLGLWGSDPTAIVVARLPIEAAEFYTGTADETELIDDRIDYVREKPASVIARSLEQQGAPRIQFNAGDVGHQIEKYLSYQVEQGTATNEDKAKMLRAVMEILRPANSPGAR